jgi:hypothetical protein
MGPGGGGEDLPQVRQGEGGEEGGYARYRFLRVQGLPPGVLSVSFKALLSILAAVSFNSASPQLPRGRARSPRDPIEISWYGLALVPF